VQTSFTIGAITTIIQLIFIESFLSIDNAAVLGAMVSVLPANEPVPYGKQLKFLQGFTDRVLGMQQMAALKIGLLGAYVGRGAMLAVAAWVSNNQVLKILGAAYLVKLAFDNLSRSGQLGDVRDSDLPDGASRSFWLVVLNVELLDLAFSLDNVVAAVSLSSELWVVTLGVAVGIVTVRFAAGIFTWLIRREPILITAAYIVVFNIGAELLLAEGLDIHFAAWQKFAISIATLLLSILYARVKFLNFLEPVFHWLGRIIGALNQLADRALAPGAALSKMALRGLFKLTKLLLRRRSWLASSAVRPPQSDSSSTGHAQLNPEISAIPRESDR
jgi:tellurite resistance protein TerC